MAIAPSLPRHLLATAVSINQIRDAPDWTRTSMPIKAQALNLPCIPNSTTGADESPNYTHQEIRLSSEISVSNHRLENTVAHDIMEPMCNHRDQQRSSSNHQKPEPDALQHCPKPKQQKLTSQPVTGSK